MTYIKCPKDKAKILAIALIYSFQNLLNYYALRKLEAVYFQIFNQLKIITTALFSVALLSTRISSRKWAALVLLAGGAAFIQVEQAYLLAVPKEELHLNVDISEALGKSAKFSDSFKGFIACLIAALTSGFAGVCYEKIIKGKNLDMWQTNVDLSLFSIGISTFVVFFDKGVRANGFFAGYNLLTAGSVVVTGCGGLLVSAVVKYSSTIIKGFVVSFGIVACALLDFFSNSVKPSVCFLVSLCVVLLAVQLYNF